MSGSISQGRKKVIFFTVRTSPSLKARLIEASDLNRRSLTQEIESRLERSLVLEELEGGTLTATWLRELALAIRRVEQDRGRSWLIDREAWSEVSKAITKAFAVTDVTKLQPEHGSTKAPLLSTAQRVAISVRCSAELEQKLQVAAEINVRSLTKEVEERLEHSLASSESENVAPTARFLHFLGASISELEGRTGKSWWQDAGVRLGVGQLLRDELRKRRPPLDVSGSSIELHNGRRKSRQ